MKNGKRLAAILGVICLAAVCAMPMFFAFGTGPDAEGRFRASLGVAILVPFMAYAIVLVYNLLNRKAKKPSGKIKNIIFDVGNVLMRYDWEGYLRSFGFDEEEYQTLADNIFRSQIWRDQDRSDRPAREYLDRFMEASPAYRDDVKRVWEGADATIHPLDYADTWTRYLKDRGYRLFVLSNYCTYILETTRSEMTFLKNMDGVIFSCEVKLCKPEKEIYECLLSRYHLDASESVFLDDTEENCEGARKAGLFAIHFENMPQAVEELKKLGVE